MRKNPRRLDSGSATKVQEIRNINQAFGSTAAKAFGKRNFLNPTLVHIALLSRFERRQRLRRVVDHPEGTEPVPTYK